MYLIDAFFRFTGVAMLALLAITAYRDNRNWQSSPYLILACISLIGLYMGYTLDALRAPEPLHTLFRLIDVPHLMMVWLFALSLYQADFRLNAFHWLVGLTYCAPIVWVRLAGFGWVSQYPDWLINYVSATSFLLAGHLIFATLSEWRDDLQEQRRKSRFYFVLVVVLAIGAAALAEPKLGRDAVLNLRTFTILTIWPAIAAGAYWMLAADVTSLECKASSATGQPRDEKDAALLTKLKAAVEGQEVFRNSDLSIAGLAANLGVTQHRLRALINQTLGHRNFSSFLNGYRLDAVTSALSDPKNAHLPIQTIAFDCGFKSMATFNRAFRAREGMTPSDYRQALGQTYTH